MTVYESVLITGGGGMLAGAFAQGLQTRGVRTRALSREQLDITSEDQIKDVLAEDPPTLILNCAAYTKVDQAEIDERATLINASAVGTLAAHAMIYGAMLVHFSTDFVFDGASQTPYPPDAPTRPVSAYGRSKRLGEQEAFACGPADTLIVRTSWLYGPNGPNFVQTMLNLGRAGKPLQVVNDQTGSPTFTHDLAEITLDLIDNDARGIYHATNSGQTTWFDFARAIFDEFDVKADLLPTTAADWKTKYPNSAPRPRYSVLDCSETERVIGRPLPDWREALHRYRLAIESA